MFRWFWLVCDIRYGLLFVLIGRFGYLVMVMCMLVVGWLSYFVIVMVCDVDILVLILVVVCCSDILLCLLNLIFVNDVFVFVLKFFCMYVKLML